MPRERRSVALTRLTKGSFARDLLAGSAPQESFVLPAKHTGWVRERSERMVATLRAGSYDVVGDLDDLLPADPRSGRTPDQASDAEAAGGGHDGGRPDDRGSHHRGGPLMARRVFVHIGTPKSGTTYLQSLWWHNRAALAEQGLLLPGGSADVQFQASAVVRDNAGVLETMTERQLGAWDRLVDEVEAWQGDALISQEQLVETSLEDAAAALARLRAVADEVHVVVTARDLVPPGAERVAAAGQARVAEHAREVLQARGQGRPGLQLLAPPGRAADPRALGGRPAARAGPRRRAAAPGCPVRPAAGGGPASCSGSTTPACPSTHPWPTRPLPRPRSRSCAGSTRTSATPTSTWRCRAGSRASWSPGSAAPPARIALAPEMHAWLVERGNRMVDELAAGPWHVVGDLDDLRPDPEPGDGVDPDAVPDAEVLAVAQDFLAAELLARAEPSATPAAPPAERALGGFGSRPPHAPLSGGSYADSPAAVISRVRRPGRVPLADRARRGQRGTSAQ